MIEASAKLSNVRISPKKVRLVAGAIRGLEVTVALQRLAVMFKKSSPVMEKLLKSAVANAIDKYEIKEEDLLVKSVTVDKGLDYKRWRPAAFGRAHKYNKHGSHIKIVVVGKEGVKATIKDKPKAEVETVDLTTTDKKTTKKTDLKEVKEDKKDITKAGNNKSTKKPAVDKKDNTKVKKG